MNATTQNAGAAQFRADRDLQALSIVAGQMENALREVAAVIDAITGGGLLDAAPADSDDANRHSAATTLLDMLRDRVRQIEEQPGTDLSITLSVMAKEARS